MVPLHPYSPKAPWAGMAHPEQLSLTTQGPEAKVFKAQPLAQEPRVVTQLSPEPKRLFTTLRILGDEEGHGH